MPRYDRYVKLRETLANSVVRGVATVKWAEDGKSFAYDKGGKSMVYTIATGKEVEGTIPTPAAPTPPTGRRRGGGGAPARGRQFDTAFNADQSLKAVSKDRNIILSDGKGNNPINVTTEGSAERRLKFGIASWVYGEELEVREAMWFSPDSKKLAFYKFDESKVLDYYLTMDQKQIQTKLDVEAYPKAGAPNPEVTLLVYDIASKTTKAIDTKFADPSLGEYVYAVRWSPDGTELLFNRTNRRQNTMELCAANPETGVCRTIVREKTSNGWVDNSPAIQWLADNKRFIWTSERNGFRNLYLYDISGKLIRPLTQGNFEVEGVKKLDEKAGLLFYTARSAPNPYLRQLHRVRLDGKGENRLTDPALSHTVDIAPDNGTFVDVAETTDTPPVTTLRDMKGKALVELAKSDLTKFDAAGFKKTERFTFTAADGKTTCYGSVQFPSDFDPSKKWPVIVSVYGGPDSGGGIERFQTPDAITELGFLHVQMDGRGTAGRGREFKDAVYEKLGVV
jgi:dipeptidyl-peptidase 4